MAQTEAPLDEWPDVDESAGSLLCYTSGTTGNPKGALYSQRSMLLHAFGACSADGLAVSRRDTILELLRCSMWRRGVLRFMPRWREASSYCPGGRCNLRTLSDCSDRKA
ncbi:hypothetical protein BZM27_54070 [Paraburkholderia steynii]|uniref:AMP-dependent synthetase/ligase domain-containing protein n=1 Tax=Paraburkholderia steynii TaxID=1245441 RepID=A0A4R0WYB2_9BURK|nr:hypothetical protein BZM27_54070 [Paraburkholderia steynii]